jgi:hypothetical protein
MPNWGREQMYRIIGADGREYGPVSDEQVRQWIAQGRATARTQARREGVEQWRLLAEFAEFGPALAVGVTTRAAPPAPPATNGMAVTGLILGVASLVMGLCCGGPVLAILGLVFSSIGISQINSSPVAQQGKGMAIAGLIASGFGLALYLLIMIFFGALGFVGFFMEPLLE